MFSAYFAYFPKRFPRTRIYFECSISMAQSDPFFDYRFKIISLHLVSLRLPAAGKERCGQVGKTFDAADCGRLIFAALSAQRSLHGPLLSKQNYHYQDVVAVSREM